MISIFKSIGKPYPFKIYENFDFFLKSFKWSLHFSFGKICCNFFCNILTFAFVGNLKIGSRNYSWFFGRVKLSQDVECRFCDAQIWIGQFNVGSLARLTNWERAALPISKLRVSIDPFLLCKFYTPLSVFISFI